MEKNNTPIFIHIDKVNLENYIIYLYSPIGASFLTSNDSLKSIKSIFIHIDKVNDTVFQIYPYEIKIFFFTESYERNLTMVFFPI